MIDPLRILGMVLILLSTILGYLIIDYIRSVARTQYVDPETGIIFRRCWQDFTSKKAADEIAHELWHGGSAIRQTGPDERGRYQVWHSISQIQEAG